MGEIRAILFDLGDTLVTGEKALPGVPEMLQQLQQVEPPVPFGLVSDWTMPEPGAPKEDVAQLVAEYLEVLTRTGLRQFFEPVGGRVTLSTEAGARKPDRRVFALALERLGVPGAFGEALFITENVGHVESARGLGMKSLRFGAGGEVSDWTTGAPALLELVTGERVATEDSARRTFERMLRANDLVAPAGEPLRPGQTHEESTDGKPAVRKRFSLC